MIRIDHRAGPDPLPVTGGDLLAVAVDDQGAGDHQQGEQQPAELALGEPRRQLVAQAERVPSMAAGLEQLFREPRTTRRRGHPETATRAARLASAYRSAVRAARASSRVRWTGIERSRPVISSTRRTWSFWLQITRVRPLLAAVEALPGTDDESDPGGVDELALGKIDQHRSLVAVKCLLERALELGGGAEIKLAADRNRPHALLEIPGLYLERGWIHGTMLPQDD